MENEICDWGALPPEDRITKRRVGDATYRFHARKGRTREPEGRGLALQAVLETCLNQLRKQLRRRRMNGAFDAETRDAVLRTEVVTVMRKCLPSIYCLHTRTNK